MCHGTLSLGSTSASGTSHSTPGEVEALLRRITGAPAALAVHSYAGALWLTLATLANNREVLVSRAEVGEVESAGPLPRLAAAAGAILRDVGTANRTTAADYEVAALPRAAALLKLDSDEYRIVGATASTQLEELVALAARSRAGAHLCVGRSTPGESTRFHRMARPLRAGHAGNGRGPHNRSRRRTAGRSHVRRYPWTARRR